MYIITHPKIPASVRIVTNSHFGGGVVLSIDQRSNPVKARYKLKKAAKEARYGRLGLRENPFPDQPTVSPSNPDPRRNGSIYCKELHEDKRKQLEKLIIPRGAATPV